jgi:multidrug efflux pump subunit AcrB
MGIVRFALRWPHTFYVLAALILFLGVTALRTMPVDIFPEINIPVVSVIWQYTGLSTSEMEQRVTTYGQYSISSNVNGIKDIEAETVNGISIQKIYFQPDVNLDLAIAQIVAATNSIRALMPPGIQAPVVVQYNASSVPVLQLSLSSDTLNEQQLYDYGIYKLRQMIAPIHGVTLPTPAGGKYRQIMVDLDTDKLLAKGLTPLDVVNAVNAQNLTLPSGTAKIGDTQYTVRTNATPPTIDDLNDIPVKFANGATVFIKDVGQGRDGNLVQQNVVRAQGKRSVLLGIIKNGNASTLAVVNAVKAVLRVARAAAPPGLNIKELFDQSVFVTQSVDGVLREGAIAAGLTALMILIFLGSWRSTLVVMITIPLAMLTSIVALNFLGETINTMTLGGLALAVGILVDDSTVTIENTHRLLTEERKPLPEATLYGAAGIAVPTLVSTLAISCVFTSVIFLEGPAKYLFTPLGLAVVFAMLASYSLSRTLTPITIGLLLKGERHGATDGGTAQGWFGHFHHRFERGFERLRRGYVELLTMLLTRRVIVPVFGVVVLALGATMFVFVGRDFFPVIDGGQIQLHVRAPAGTRIERTEQIFQAVEDKIREVIPERDRELIVDNFGVPARSYNWAFSDGTTIAVNDGVIMVALKDGHAPTAEYVRKLRDELPAAFPEDMFYFQPADMVTQILNFGLTAQIDVRTVGYDRVKNLRVAHKLERRIAAVPGIVDAHLQQEVYAPDFYVTVDRARAAQFGLTASSVATNLNVSLSSSEQVTLCVPGRHDDLLSRDAASEPAVDADLRSGGRLDRHGSGHAVGRNERALSRREVHHSLPHAAGAIRHAGHLAGQFSAAAPTRLARPESDGGRNRRVSRLSARGSGRLGARGLFLGGDLAAARSRRPVLQKHRACFRRYRLRQAYWQHDRVHHRQGSLEALRARGTATGNPAARPVGAPIAEAVPAPGAQGGALGTARCFL